MKMFAGQQVEPLFQFSWLVVTLTLLLCGTVALALGFTVDPRLAAAVALTLLALLYVFFGRGRRSPDLHTIHGSVSQSGPLGSTGDPCLCSLPADLRCEGAKTWAVSGSPRTGLGNTDLW